MPLLVDVTCGPCPCSPAGTCGGWPVPWMIPGAIAGPDPLLGRMEPLGMQPLSWHASSNRSLFRSLINAEGPQRCTHACKWHRLAINSAQRELLWPLGQSHRCIPTSALWFQSYGYFTQPPAACSLVRSTLRCREQKLLIASCEARASSNRGGYREGVG